MNKNTNDKYRALSLHKIPFITAQILFMTAQTGYHCT